MTTCRSFFPGASELEAGATSDPSILDHPHYTKKKRNWNGNWNGTRQRGGWLGFGTQSANMRGFQKWRREQEREKSGNTGSVKKMGAMLAGELKYGVSSSCEL